MVRFEVVSKYADAGLSLPERKTAYSAGYDFEVAQDTIVLPYMDHFFAMKDEVAGEYSVMTLEEISSLTKSINAKPTLVPTGIKCQMAPNTSLELYVRSSAPLKNWLMLANGVGVVDADYYNNIDNEGEIFFQVINLSPFPILLKKGDTIGQGVIRQYEVVSDDKAVGGRVGGFGSTGANFG